MNRTILWTVVLLVLGWLFGWTTRSGFDKFYGFIGGETNQWSPAIFEDMSRIEPIPTTALLKA